LDSIDSPVYVADMESYELLYVNAKTREQFGEVQGQLCWKALQKGQDGPCPFCTNRLLLDPNGQPTGPQIWEGRNTALGRWFHCIDRAIRWDDGRFVRMEVAIDVTERRRSEEAAAYRAELQSTLAEVSSELLQSSEPALPDLLARAMDAMRRCLHAEAGVLIQAPRGGAEVVLRRVPEAQGDWARAQPAGAVCALLGALRDGQGLCLGAGRRADPELARGLEAVGLGGCPSVLLIPLSCAGEPAVTMGFGCDRPEREWLSDERDAVLVLGNLIGNAVCRQQSLDALRASREQLADAAFRDPLTGLGNRRLLVERMGQAASQAERDGTLFAVCYLDLDGFKGVNDRFGHEVGDRLLELAARRLCEGVRPHDTVARWGGDELALLLTDLRSVEQCSEALERLRAALAEPYAVDGRSLKATASIGASLYPRDGREGQSLLCLADRALYGAKRNGRNRVEIFDPERDPAP
jgi:diguanylate cyclase (GGDEF)-like protein